MGDLEVSLDNHNIHLIEGRFVHLYETEEYSYGCSMTLDEWECIKINIDSLISKSKGEVNG